MIKKLVLLLFICVLMQLCLAQTSYYKEINLYSYYPATFNARSVFPCSDNSVILVGEFSYLAEIILVFTVCVIKLDANGNCIWQRLLWTENELDRISVTGINIDEYDNVYYFVQNDGINKLYKTNTNGYSRLISSHNSNSFTQIARAIRLSNNEIIAVGRGRGPSPYSNNYSDYYAFMRMSATGDSISYRQYPPAQSLDYSHVQAYDLEIDFDGMPVATCYINDNTLSVVKFDLFGNIINRNDWYFGPYLSSNLLITKQTTDSTLVVGYGDNEGYHLLKYGNSSLDTMFTIQGMKSYKALLGGNDHLFIAGNDYDFNQSTVNSFDFMGNQNWSWRVSQFSNGSYNPSPERLAIAPDSTIIFVGGESSLLYIVKLLPNGQITENNDEMVYPVHNDLIVYPNPMRHTLNIEVSGIYKSVKASEKVMIYNVKGQSIRTINLQNKADNKYSAVWDGKDSKGLDCATGVYYCKTSLDGRNLIKKIILTK